MGDLHVTVSGEPFARNVVRLLNVIEGVYNNTYVMFRATPGITLGELRLNLAGAEDKVPEQAPLTVVRVTRIQSYQIVVTGDWTTLAIITAAIGATIHCGRKLAEAIKAGVEIPKAIAETNKIKAETKRIEAETKKTERDANKSEAETRKIELEFQKMYVEFLERIERIKVGDRLAPEILSQLPCSEQEKQKLIREKVFEPLITTVKLDEIIKAELL